jgi:hypothetical protein
VSAAVLWVDQALGIWAIAPARCLSRGAAYALSWGHPRALKTVVARSDPAIIHEQKWFIMKPHLTFGFVMTTLKTSDLLHLQALLLKQRINHHFIKDDADAPDWLTETYSRSSETRNICAHIPAPLFDEISRLSSWLVISKRAVIEIALRDFAVSANKAMSDVGLDPSHFHGSVENIEDFTGSAEGTE